jgi:hypothetical protein
MKKKKDVWEKRIRKHIAPKGRGKKPNKKTMEILKQLVTDMQAVDPDSTFATRLQSFIDSNPTLPTGFDSVTITVNGVAKVAPASAFV